MCKTIVVHLYHTIKEKEMTSSDEKMVNDNNDRLFGFDGDNSCIIGRLEMIVRSNVSPDFDLAYLEDFRGMVVIGLLASINPHLHTI